MADDRSRNRRVRRLAFQPTLDGTLRLEPRVLLSRITLPTPGPIRFQTGATGQRLRVIDTDGEVYDVIVEGLGTVRGTKASNGRVNLILDGTDQNSIVSVNPVRVVQQGLAHRFPRFGPKKDTLLHLNNVTVTSGELNQFLAYRTADLSGSLVISGTPAVDRIALTSVVSGGSISVGGDLNTLDVLNALTLDAGPGLIVGRDLNWMTVGQSVIVQNGANFIVGRDVGLASQPAKGTGTAGAGANVGGDLFIDVGSQLVITRFLDAVFAVQGSGFGASRIVVGGGPGSFFVRGGFVA